MPNTLSALPSSVYKLSHDPTQSIIGDPSSDMAENPYAAMTDAVLFGAINGLLGEIDAATGLDLLGMVTPLENLLGAEHGLLSGLVGFLNPATWTTGGGVFGALIRLIPGAINTLGDFVSFLNPSNLIGVAAGIFQPIMSGIGHFLGSLIPGLDASKITSGVFSLAQLPGEVLTTITGVAQSLVSGLGSALNTLGSGIQSTIDGIVNSIGGFIGTFWTQGQANDVMTAQAAAVAAAAAAVAQLENAQNNQNYGGLNASVDFSRYPNSTNLPSIFDETYVGGSGTFGIANGVAWTTQSANYFETRDVYAKYNVADTVTDYQRVGGVWTGMPGMSWQNPTPFPTPVPYYAAYYSANCLYVRFKDVNNWVRLFMSASQNAYLQCCVGGVVTTLDTWDHVFQPNSAYWLEAGTVSNILTFRVLIGTKVIRAYTDTAAVTQYGALFRSGAVGGQMKGYEGAGHAVNPSALLHWSMQDNAPAGVVGSGARFYRAATGSVSVGNATTPNNFFDTVEYQTDEYGWAPGDGCKVTVSVSDWYVVSVKFKFSSSSTAAAVLLKNETIVRQAEGSGGAPASLGTWIIYLAAGDYIQGANSGTVACVGDAAGAGSALEITRVGKAAVTT